MPTILIADDERSVRQNLRLFLTLEYRVAEAASVATLTAAEFRTRTTSPLFVDANALAPESKRELESVVASKRTSQTDRQLAREVGQWLTVWLQNPAIFDDWFELRRKTHEFIQLFGS